MFKIIGALVASCVLLTAMAPRAHANETANAKFVKDSDPSHPLTPPKEGTYSHATVIKFTDSADVVWYRIRPDTPSHSPYTFAGNLELKSTDLSAGDCSTLDACVIQNDANNSVTIDAGGNVTCSTG